jgi:hypothetical protein
MFRAPKFTSLAAPPQDSRLNTTLLTLAATESR